MRSSKVITLLLLGVVGGILIAPAKGSKTRKKLTKLVNDVSDSLQDIIELFRDRVSELSDQVVEGEENSVANH